MKPYALTLRIVLAATVTGVIVWALLNRSQFDPMTLSAWLASFGIWAPIVYVLLFAIGTVAFLPGSLFALAGGVLFGPVWGSVLNLLGAPLGASLAFLIARYLAGDWVSRKAGGSLKKLVTGVEAEGWRFVAFVRLVPLFPFNLTNYALGLTRISFLPYVFTSLVCMVPGAIAYTWLGHAGREAMAGNGAAIKYGLPALGLLAAIAFLPRLFSRLRTTTDTGWIEADELNRQIGSGDVPVILDVRGGDEFTGSLGHIPGALNIPLGDIPIRLSEIKAHRNRPFILVCKTDKRSAQAAKLLRDARFEDLHVLRGGMEQWRWSRFQVEGESVPPGSNRRPGIGIAQH